MARAANKQVLPSTQDARFSKTRLLVHAKPYVLKFSVAALVARAETANCSQVLCGAQKTPTAQKSVADQRMTKQKHAPLRQNACNFWPLKNMRLDLSKYVCSRASETLVFSKTVPSCTRNNMFQTWSSDFRLWQDTSDIRWEWHAGLLLSRPPLL